MLRWLHTDASPTIARWWSAQSARAKLAVAVAAIFALASMLNLASASIGRAMTSRAPAAIAATAFPATSIPILRAEVAPTDAGKTWSVVKAWQGSGAKETEEFVVGEHWRVDWLFSPVQTGGLLQAFIYAADGRLLMNVTANTQKGGADTSFWAGPGKYFLKVNSTGGDWKLDVQNLP